MQWTLGSRDLTKRDIFGISMDCAWQVGYGMVTNYYSASNRMANRAIVELVMQTSARCDAIFVTPPQRGVGMWCGGNSAFDDGTCMRCACGCEVEAARIVYAGCSSVFEVYLHGDGCGHRTLHV